MLPLLVKKWTAWETSDFFVQHYTLNVRFWGKQLVLFSREFWCFLRQLDIKCYISRLSLQCTLTATKEYALNGANQNSRLGTYKNTNLFNSQNLWMNDLQSTFLILSALLLSYFFCLHLLLFPLWDKFENHCFLAWGFMVLLCLFTTKKTGSQWQDLAVFFPPSITPLLNMLQWSRAVMYPKRGTLLNVSRSGSIWF